MSRARKRLLRTEVWLVELAERVRYFGVLEQARHVDAAIHEAAAEHGIEPWRLARRIAGVWRDQGHIASLTPGGDA